jgi:putative ABC transport system permease protein
MLKHLFKLIWKKKKSSSLMMLEIFVSFLILFAVWSLSIYNYRNYTQPSGINTENVWKVSLNFNTDADSVKNIYRDLVKQKMKLYKEVESFAFSSNNIPYSDNFNGTGLKYKKIEVGTQVLNVEPNYTNVLGIKLSEGRWFTEADKVNKNKAVVITRLLKEKLFGNENALGKLMDIGDKDKWQVIGIVDNFKNKSDFQNLDRCTFKPLDGWESDLVVKVMPGTAADFEAKLSKELVQLGKDWSVEIQQLDSMRVDKNKQVWIPILILFIVCGFLVFNVALGLFGVLFQTISRRKAEIGVRRAIGATKNHILQQFIGETLVIATFGLLLGLFFAIQFPLLNVFDVDKFTYLMGILLAIISIYLLVILCAFLPSKQASLIYPAVALHEE